MSGFKKAFSIVALGQMTSLALSILRSLVLPLFMSVSDFGYFHSYTFYISLFPLIALGYNDGVYLRYGRYDYSKLPFGLLSAANRLYLGVSFVLSSISIFVAFVYIKDECLLFAFTIAASYAFFQCINGLMIQIFQITQQFDKYTFYTLSSRLLSTIIIIIILLSGHHNSFEIILADFISFVLVNTIIVSKNRNLFFAVSNSSIGFVEYKKNVKAGFPLLIAGLVGILFLGGGRLIVQIIGNINQFSIYSFSISIATIISVAISSVSLVVYPMVTRLTEESLGVVYGKLNSFIRITIVCIILLYYFSTFLIQTIYPNYIQTLEFLNVIFILMYFQSFIYVLQNTFYKALRMESYLMKDNFISIALIFAFGVPLFYYTKSLLFVALSTLIGQLSRYTISYYRFKKNPLLKVDYNIIDFLFVTFFLIVSSIDFFPFYTEWTIVVSMLVIYMLYRRGDIKQVMTKW